MGLTYRFKRAAKFVEDLSSEDLKKAKNICNSIHQSEKSLLVASANLMQGCAKVCGGICCKNVDLGAIIHTADFVYILIQHPNLKSELTFQLKKEDPLFSQDCVFLQNGIGPCLLPDPVKPAVCITTFCQDTSSVKRQIDKVKGAFISLDRFIFLSKFKTFKQELLNKWIFGLLNNPRTTR